MAGAYPTGRRPAATGGAIVGAWWGLYLLGTIGSRIVEALFDSATTTDDLRGLLMISSAMLAAAALSGVLLITVIHTIEARADELARSIPMSQLLAPALALAVTPAAWAPPPGGVLTPASCPDCDRPRLTNGRLCAGCGFDFAAVDGDARWGGRQDQSRRRRGSVEATGYTELPNGGLIRRALPTARRAGCPAYPGFARGSTVATERSAHG